MGEKRSGQGIAWTRPVSRRAVLKAGAAAGLGLSGLGSLAGTARGQAPAALKGTKLAILKGTYFVAAAQDLFRKQAQEWGKLAGVTVVTDFLAWANIQAKISAGVHAGGIDVVELWPAFNYLYRDNLVDVTEEAEEVGRRGGGFESYVLKSGIVGGRWYGIPHGSTNIAMNYRISWFKEAGVANAEDGAKLDMTWDDFHALAKRCKEKGRPFGQALGHSTGDPPSFCYPYMWSYGAAETDADGKVIQFNKPEFVEAVRKFIQAWKDGYDTTGTSWDDSNNNRAFLSGQVACTLNGSSIYVAAKKDRPEIAADMQHMHIPKGPAGRFYQLGTRTMGILKNSQNVPAAREFLKWWFQDEQYDTWWRLQEGYHLQHVKRLANDAMWFKDPKVTVFREEPRYGVPIGYPGPPNEKASLSWSKYIVVDVFARAVQSGDAKGAVDWGVEQLKRVYGL
jgi:multiple sugar transport system substrate-binding protein